MPQSVRPRATRSRWLQRGALALGLGAGLVLAVIAIGPLGDARATGEAALARTAGELEDAVVAEWRRLLRDGDLLDPPAHAALAWTEADAAAARASGAAAPARDFLSYRNEAASAFDAVLASAGEHEQAGDAAGALAEALAALELAEDPRHRAEGRLRAIQLAAKIGRADLAAAQWDAAAAELQGDEARGEVSYLLLDFLAAAPALDAAARAAARETLFDRWAQGRLALPAEADRLERAADGRLELRHAPLRAALAGRLGADPRLDREQAVRGLRALAAAGWTLPAPGADGVEPIVREDDVLLAARGADGFHASFRRRGELETALRDAVAAAGILPDGFVLDADGGNATLGPPLRARVQLAAGGLGFTLRHADPAAFAARAGRGALFLRLGLLALGLLCALAGVAIDRALQRERRLQHLRLEFVATVSHELRSPLTSILLMAENLVSGAAGPSAAPKYHGQILGRARRLRRLVDDLLDFSRLERGRPPEPRLEETALAAWCTALEREARELAADAGGRLAFASELDAPSAEIDGDALLRAVLNLVDNALRHGSGQEVVVTVRSRGRLRIEVRDFGCGVPAAERERIFLPFARIDGGPGGGLGLGLGLAIVRRIAEAHGGSARCEPPPDGDGALFVLELPLRRAAGPEAEPPPRAGEGGSLGLGQA